MYTWGKMWNKGNINKEMEKSKKETKQFLQLLSAITEMKISLKEFNGKFGQAEESVNLKTGQ